ASNDKRSSPFMTPRCPKVPQMRQEWPSGRGLVGRCPSEEKVQAAFVAVILGFYVVTERLLHHLERIANLQRRAQCHEQIAVDVLRLLVDGALPRNRRVLDDVVRLDL